MGKLNEQSVQVIDRIVDRHRGRLGPVKLMLHDVQKELGYIPFEAMEKIAAASGVSAAEVYGVVTFYTLLCQRIGGFTAADLRSDRYEGQSDKRRRSVFARCNALPGGMRISAGSDSGRSGIWQRDQLHRAGGPDQSDH